MSEVEARQPDDPTTRQFLYGLLFVAAIVITGVVAGAFAIATTTCCTTPADLVIVNRSHVAVSVDWATPGLLGTPLLGAGGHIDADACAVSTWSLATGAVSATIGSGTASRTAHFTVSGDRSRAPRFLLIDAQGVISDVLPDWPPGTDTTTTCP